MSRVTCRRILIDDSDFGFRDEGDTEQQQQHSSTAAGAAQQQGAQRENASAGDPEKRPGNEKGADTLRSIKKLQMKSIPNS